MNPKNRGWGRLSDEVGVLPPSALLQFQFYCQMVSLPFSQGSTALLVHRPICFNAFLRDSKQVKQHYEFKHSLPLQIKPCSELSFPVKIYFCVTILSLLSVIGLTIETLIRQTEEDFTISLIQLVGVGKKHTHCALKQSSAKVVITAMTTEGELHTSQKPLV